MVEIKLNDKEFTSAITRVRELKKTAGVNSLITNSGKKGMQYFLSKVIREQMQGRPGLKVGTGNLRRSWVVSSSRIDATTISIKLGTRTKYARIHQYGGTIRHPGGTPYFPYHIAYEGKFIPLNSSWKGAPGVKLTKPHDIKMPKRLNILEEFSNVGGKMIRDEIMSSFMSIVNK